MTQPKIVENGLSVYQFDAFRVRVIDRDGEPWWVAKDVCDVLGLEQVTRAMDRLADDECGLVKVTHPQNPAKMVEVNAVNESGLYSLILRSDKPDAKRFRHWITSEVLPSIRKTGGYNVKLPQGVELLALAVVEAQRVIEEMQPKAAGYDRLVAAEGSQCISDAAKVLGMKPSTLFDLLADRGAIFRRAGTWIASQDYIDRGWLVMKEVTYSKEEGDHMKVQTRVTAKGLDNLARLYPKTVAPIGVHGRTAGATL